MKRRDILKASLLSLAYLNFPKISFAQSNDGFIKPKKISQGDKIYILAPATSVSNPDDIQKAIQLLDYLNLEYEIAPSLNNSRGYKTKSINTRLNELHYAFSDVSINAVFCIRGGYGSGQLLPYIDYDLIKNNPKIFIGYSDITALHLAINKFSNLVTFHGPVLLSNFSNYTLENFKKVIFKNNPIGILKNPDITAGVRPAYPTRTINSGIAEGVLTGGNLSLITSLMGTKFELDTKDKILLLEDVGEEPYNIDRMLNQLKISGKLEQAKGIVFGKCANCDFDSSRIWDPSLGEVLDFYLADLDIPSFYGLLIGHTKEQLTLPLGIKAKLDADNRLLEISESAVM